MKTKISNEEEHGNEESWLLPYSDLMTLLLAVFIVLFATSQIDTAKAEAMSEAFQTVFGLSRGTELIDGGEGFLPDELTIIAPEIIKPEYNNNNAETDELRKIQQELESHIGELEMADSISVFVDERGLIVSVNNTILFDSGKADLKPEIEQMLMQIGVLISEYNNYIRVEGHTDNVPVNSDHFPSNWELSTVRASRVVRFLVDECGIFPVRLSAVGYGEFKPLDSNNTEEGRALNRRVDIIILSSKYNDLESAPFTVPEGGWSNGSS